MLRSWSLVNTAKDQGVDLLSESVVKELECAWGGPKLIRSITYKGFMLARKVKLKFFFFPLHWVRGWERGSGDMAKWAGWV